MGLFNGIFGVPKTTRENSVKETKYAVSSSDKNSLHLSKGEIVKGAIVDLRRNEVTVRLDNGNSFHAKLNSAMELSIGQEATFFVQETNDVLITLKLLSEEDSAFTEATIDKALEANGIPKSPNNVNIVRALLNAGLPANKEMIQKMMQYSAGNKDVDLSTLTALLKNNLPVTKENAATLQSYRNYEHRLTEQASSLIDHIFTEISSETSSPVFTQKLIEIFFPAGQLSPDSPEVISPVTTPPTSVPQEQVAGQMPETPLTASNLSEASDFLPVHATSDMSEPISQNTEIRLNTSSPDFHETLPLKELLSERDYEALGKDFSKVMSESPLFDKLNQDYTSGQLTARQLFSALSDSASSLSHNEIPLVFKEDAPLALLLKKTMLSHFVLTPDELTQDNAVKNFYEKITKTISSLSELVSSAQDTPQLKQAANLSQGMQDNIQFMNTLNQLFPYVQLPLKLSEQLTHGELYVYTKKKDLSAETKEVSILLHLDMTSLGPTDVRLTMLQKNVTAGFYLTSPDAVALLNQELPSLTSALEKKGYKLNAGVALREKEPDIVTDFMDVEDSVSVKRFRFDIRA